MRSKIVEKRILIGEIARLKTEIEFLEEQRMDKELKLMMLRREELEGNKR